MNARQTAFSILNKIETDNAYSNISLTSALHGTVSATDRAFIHALVFGVVKRKLTLDYFVSKYYDKSLNRLKPPVLTILRMGLYQLFYMDRVPASAAVNESVRLAASNRLTYSKGLINAVLRAASRDIPSVKAGSAPAPEAFKTKTEYYSIAYSFPVWLVERYISALGEARAVSFMRQSLLPAPLFARVNTLKTTAESLVERLKLENIDAQVINAASVKINGGVSMGAETLSAFREGLFHIQDLSSQLCCEALAPRPGDTVLDMCAAPGGKSATIAELMNNEGRIFAFDLYEKRLPLIKNNVKNLEIKIINIDQNDATVYNDKITAADRILCDVPCSGFGVVRRKPEIKYRSQEDTDALPPLQRLILSQSARYLKSGGRLVYSTCTLNPSENEEVVADFLERTPDFTLAEQKTLCSSEQNNDGDDAVGDGFFIAVMTKK